MITQLERLREYFNDRFGFQEKRPGVLQLFVPLFHEDGDMLDIFLEDNGPSMRISDQGMSLMRLSYGFDLDTENKEKILGRILSEHSVLEENGNLYLETNLDSLYPDILRFAQAISQISGMKRYRREVVQSLFFEELSKTVDAKFSRFNPKSKYYPIAEQEEYEVDFMFNGRPKPVYLFGVNSDRTARLATISMLKFLTDQLKFTGAVVLESVDLLGRKDQARLMSAADKLFPSLEDFSVNGERFLERGLEAEGNRSQA
ncbi:MAG TPA: DUF1828 domain-containing protein [Tepidisphaeraceae bacterium]|jgi:hypothetical protein|nr:DUF1828 domain-containing protein [Tepidisphaeraceae bacterium]